MVYDSPVCQTPWARNALRKIGLRLCVRPIIPWALYAHKVLQTGLYSIHMYIHMHVHVQCTRVTVDPAIPTRVIKVTGNPHPSAHVRNM